MRAHEPIGLFKHLSAPSRGIVHLAKAPQLPRGGEMRGQVAHHLHETARVAEGPQHLLRGSGFAGQLNKETEHYSC